MFGTGCVKNAERIFALRTRSRSSQSKGGTHPRGENRQSLLQAERVYLLVEHRAGARMRFLANENLPGDAVEASRAAGHDVVWVRTAAPGSANVEVLASARHDRRIVLTFDKDFGELAWRRRLPAECGIVLFRIPMPPPSGVGDALAAILSSRSDWTGHFTVVEPGRIRMRPLPDSGVQ